LTVIEWLRSTTKKCIRQLNTPHSTPLWGTMKKS
jgi:hypothetical protein